MTLDSTQLRELVVTISDRIYIQVSSWHLYLGDAGLSEALALQCWPPRLLEPMEPQQLEPAMEPSSEWAVICQEWHSH